MTVKLYVGNLPYTATETDLRFFFRKYEPLHSVILIADRDTGTPRGFGFVELDESVAKSAICDMRQIDFQGRYLRIGLAVGKDTRVKDISDVTVNYAKDCDNCVIRSLLKRIMNEFGAMRDRGVKRRKCISVKREPNSDNYKHENCDTLGKLRRRGLKSQETH